MGKGSEKRQRKHVIPYDPTCDSTETPVPEPSKKERKKRHTPAQELTSWPPIVASTPTKGTSVVVQGLARGVDLKQDRSWTKESQKESYYGTVVSTYTSEKQRSLTLMLLALMQPGVPFPVSI